MAEIGTIRDRVVKCATCGQPAIARELIVRTDYGERKVYFETHARGIDSEDHAAVFERLRSFHTAMLKLQHDLRAAQGNASIHLNGIRPSACDVRTDILIEAFVGKREFQLPVRSLDGQTVEGILNEVTAAMESD